MHVLEAGEALSFRERFREPVLGLLCEVATIKGKVRLTREERGVQ